MLQVINRLINKWVILALISFIAFAFMFWGVEYYIQGETGSNATVATVDGAHILRQDLDSAFSSVQRKIAQQQGGAALNNQQRQQWRQYTLQGLIQEMALSHAATKAGVYVSPEQAQQMLMTDPGLQLKGKFDPQRLEQFVYANGLTMQKFMSQFQRNLTIEQIQAGIQNSAIVLPGELQRVYALQKQKRSAGYLVLPRKRYLSKAKVTQKNIDTFYQQNKLQFQTPEKVSIDYIMLSPSSMKKQVQVSEQQLRDYYQSNQVNYTIPQRWQIQKIEASDLKTIQKVHAQLKKQGASFASVAKQNQAESFAPQWLSQAAVAPTLADFLSKLSVKQVSAPFKTSQGYAVVKLLNLQASKLRPFADVKGKIRKMLEQQKLDQLLEQKNEQVSDLTYTNPNSLAAAAKALAVPVQHSELFGRNATLKGVLADPKVIAAAFSQAVLQQGVNSNPISLKDGSLMVLRVAKHVASASLPLQKVQAKIRSQLQTQYADRLAALDGYNIQMALQGKQKGAALAKDHGTRWRVVNQVARDNKKVEPALLQAIFSTQPNTPETVQLKNGDYAVVQVTTVSNGAFTAATQKEKDALAHELQGLWGQLAYRLYVAGAMSHAKIKVVDKSLK
jgi:peptidyl-prolyl cis-trans isomerase D